MASFATGVAHILKAAHKRVNTDILALLKRDSEVLAEIDSMFSIWLRKKGRGFRLTCFSEEHELPGIGMVRLVPGFEGASTESIIAGCVQGIFQDRWLSGVFNTSKPYGTTLTAYCGCVSGLG